MNKVLVAVLALTVSGLARGALTVETKNLAAAGEWPALALRGFGTVSGKAWTDGRGGSLLVLECEDEAKAKLTQAKYLSDLQTLPPLPVKVSVSVAPGVVADAVKRGVGAILRGVPPVKKTEPTAAAVADTVKSLTVSAWQTEDGAARVALRDGQRVMVAAAPSAPALAALLASSLSGAWAGVESEPSVSVPMWLDRWDRHSFRFYYGAFMRPKGEDGRTVKFYDPTQDYEFAKKNNAGLILWTTPTQVDTGENIMKDNEWLFAFLTGKKFGLSLGINTNLGDAPYWLFNRRPDWRLQYQPQFLGTYYGSMNFGIGELLSWCAAEGRDAALAEMQQTVKKFGGEESVLTWLEPHSELGHGVADWLVEYGPVADADFRGYLQKQYGEVAKLNAAWDAQFRDWNEVRVPEVASFLGWNQEAFDLTGEWKFSYDDYGSPKLADADDAAWPSISAPGHALVRYMPRQPATFRRHFKLDASWSAGQKVWLYLWDLNDTRGGKADKSGAFDPLGRVHVWLNGSAVPEQPPVISADHWVALEVSDLLRAGDNTLTVSLPKGMFNYRAYLSPHEPRAYPDLPPGENARWADFALWNFQIRANAVKRGLQMIRQADPNRGIFLASPDSFLDAVLPLAREYKGDFHNTGYMAGWWCDVLPAAMRGAGLPMSVEPGGPAKTPEELQSFFGNWLSEGVNGIDYFMHLGEVMWNPAIKKMFEDHIQVYGSAGRYHSPRAELAALYSGRSNALTAFPWRAGWLGQRQLSPWLAGGYLSPFNVRKIVSPVEYMPALPFAYESDVLTESSFTTSGDPAHYKMIVDAGTSTMDAPTVSGIEKYVRDGGVFVVFGETARNSPAKKDVWLLETLTGYKVTGGTENQPRGGTLTVAAGQEILSPSAAEFLTGKFSGLSFEKTAPDAIDLLKWDDGKVAAGARPLGKGWFIYVGAWQGQGMARLFDALLKWRGIQPVPARMDIGQYKLVWRHFVSNSGLYDVWLMFNRERELRFSGEFELTSPSAPAWAWDLQNNKKIPVAGGKFKVDIEPLGTNVWLTPRSPSAAAADWLGLQRDWWRAVTADLGAPLTLTPAKLAEEISDGWRMKILDGDDTLSVSDAVQPGFNDSGWEQRRLGIFTLPDHPGAKHALFRREFTVPEQWNTGVVKLWLASRLGHTFIGKAKVYLDGKLLVENSSAVMGSDGGGALKAGTKHTLAVEFAGEDAILGSRGETWLAWHPSPAATQDLSGEWEIAKDGLHWEKLPLPGPFVGTAARQVVNISAAHRGKNVIVHADGDGYAIRAVIINGHAVPRAHGRYGTEVNINITPYVNFGADNEIMFACSEGDRWKVSEVWLEYHQPESYP